MPIILELKAEQQVTYQEIADELAANGFEVEPFGQRTVAIKAAPADTRADDVGDLMREILDNARQEGRTVSLDDPAEQDRRLGLLPRGDQSEHAARQEQNGLAASSARQDGVPHDLPARPAHGAAVWDEGFAEGV